MNATIRWIPRGDLGARATLSEMRRLVNESLTDPAVVWRAKRLVADAPSRDQRSQAALIRSYLALYTSFLPDPLGVENVNTPRLMLDAIESDGTAPVDCDDVAVLSSSLLKSVGIPSSFVVLGFGTEKAPYTHVYTMAHFRNGGRMDMDVTRAVQSLPIRPARVAEYRV